MSGAWLEKLVGADAFSATTAQFAQPAVGDNVSSGVADTSWMSAGMGVFVAGGGYYTVVTVNSTTSATLRNTGAAENAAPATAILPGARISPAGLPGINGINGTNGTGRSAVRAVQTAALPAFTYAAGVITVTALGALSSSVFDGCTLALNDAVEINGNGVAASTNGIYLCSQVGDVSHQPQFTRRSDLDSSGDFSGGVAYEVQDGSTLKGTRRQLYTLGTITLDTTPLLFGFVVSPELKTIDLSRAPWFVTSAPSVATYTNQSPTINSAIYYYSQLSLSTGIRYRLSLPAGVIGVKEPIRLRSNVDLDSYGVTFASLGIFGGPMFWSGVQTPYSTAGALVDTTANSTPLVMYDADPNKNPVLNLTASGIRMGETQNLPTASTTSWPQLDLRMMLCFDSLADGHVVSCRGSLHGNITELFKLTAGVAGNLAFTLRVSSQTAIQPVGVVTSPLPTLSGLALRSDHNFRMRVVVGGTVGTAKVQISLSGGRTWLPGLLTTAASVSTGSALSANGALNGTVINFPAGTYVAGDTWSNTESQTVTLPNGTISAGTNYLFVSQYDGTNSLKIACSAVGSTLTFSAPVTFSATGWKLAQFIFEDLMIGAGQNSKAGETIEDIPSAKFRLGSFMLSRSIDNSGGAGAFRPVSGTVAAAMAAPSGTGIADVSIYFRPRTGNRLLDADGTVVGWSPDTIGIAGSPGGPIYLMARRASANSAFTGFFALRGAQVNTIGTVPRQAVFIDTFSTAWALEDCSLSGLDGLYFKGTGYSGVVRNCSLTAARYCAIKSNAEVHWAGTNTLTGDGILYYDGVGGGLQAGNFRFQPGNWPYAVTVIDNAVTQSWSGVNVDQESSRGCAYAAHSFHVQAGYTLSWDGVTGLSAPGQRPVHIAANSAGRINFNGVLGGHLGDTLFVCDDALGGVELGPGFGANNSDGAYQLSDTVGVVHAFGAIRRKITLTDAPATSCPRTSTITRYELPASTTTQVNALTIPTAGAQEGDRLRFKIGVQGNNVTITNGGAGGGVLATVTAGQSLTAEYEWFIDASTLVGNWVSSF